METTRLAIDRDHAREIYRSYLKHRHYETDIDREIKRAARAIASGQLVIKALASIAAAGLRPDGLPHLAICRADARVCHVTVEHDGSASFTMDRWTRWNHVRQRVDLEKGSFLRSSPMYQPPKRAETLVPTVPLPLRPKRGLANYHVLWEVEHWRPAPPGDPYLLRRIGRGDLWVVCAMWDLTEIERAVLESRVPVH